MNEWQLRASWDAVSNAYVKVADLTYFSLPWRDLPGRLPVGVEIFAIGDVHGQADLLDAALTAIGKAPRSAAARHLVFLGDLIDRRPNSIAAVQMAMDGKARAAADHLHILPGNHDLMLVDALNAEKTLEHWLSNGGKTVLAEVGLSWPEASWLDIVMKGLFRDMPSRISPKAGRANPVNAAKEVVLANFIPCDFKR